MNKKLKAAASLLKLQWGYVNGSHTSNMSFDFKVDKEDIEVFSTHDVDCAFYWIKEISFVANACRLSCFASVRHNKVVIVMHC